MFIQDRKVTKDGIIPWRLRIEVPRTVRGNDDTPARLPAHAVRSVSLNRQSNPRITAK
jgi:hypothetical protein